MHDFHEPADPNAHDFEAHGGDPLDRLVEAFVDLSVPEGPDAATQQSLVARLTRGTIELAPPTTLLQSTRGTSRAERWSFVLQTLATAAVLAVAATAIFTMLRRDRQGADPAAPKPQQLVAAPSSSVDIAVVASGDDLKDLVDFYLRARSRLAKSQSWQQAHQRLSSALERPEVIGVGVGLLGTVPWASYARF